MALLSTRPSASIGVWSLAEVAYVAAELPRPEALGAKALGAAARGAEACEVEAVMAEATVESKTVSMFLDGSRR